MLNFALPDFAAPNEQVKYWWTISAPIAIHYPGKVPVFLHAAELLRGTTTDVVLHGDELVVEFYLLLPEGVPHGTIADSTQNHGRFDRRVFAPDEDPKASMKYATWQLYRMKPYVRDTHDPHHVYDNTRALEQAVKQPWQPWWEYDSWYTRQWKYNPATGMWQVVLPHAGRLVIFLHEEHREWTNTAGDKTSDWMMYPGLYIDATDPANPVVELIYPPH
ncbi:MAG: hypothetical protein IT464_09160 [Planctomycetes bacterium]|nr:hypothetical protein [Planctomycetota bacterium]